MRRHLLLTTKIVVLGAALAVTAALSAYVTVKRSISGRDVQVPDLIEMTVEEAAAFLGAQGLVLEETGQRYDARVEEGKILAQDPLPDTSSKLQRKVKVVVSLGDKVTSIPELRGGAARKAQITLQQQGMTVAGQIYAFSRQEGENLVIAQDPLPGVASARDSRVALLVSRGRRPRTYVMPDLTGQPEGPALSFLARAGLRPGPVRQLQTFRAAPGTVVRQWPEAGYRVRGGDLVILTIARGSDDDG